MMEQNNAYYESTQAEQGAQAEAIEEEVKEWKSQEVAEYISSLKDDSWYWDLVNSIDVDAQPYFLKNLYEYMGSEKFYDFVWDVLDVQHQDIIKNQIIEDRCDKEIE